MASYRESIVVAPLHSSENRCKVILSIVLYSSLELRENTRKKMRSHPTLVSEHDPLGGIVADHTLDRVAFLLATVTRPLPPCLLRPLGRSFYPINEQVMDLWEAPQEFLDRPDLARWPHGR